MIAPLVSLYVVGNIIDANRGALCIEPFEFVRRGERRRGLIGVTDLPRVALEVAAGLQNPKAELAWEALGELQKEAVHPGGKAAFLNLVIKGSVELVCQRCLEPMTWPLDLSMRYWLIPLDQPLPEEELEEDRYDALPVGRELDLSQLIEEEVLLNFPLSPRHVQCASPGEGGAGRSNSPFAALAQLKRRQ
jgi:uncharacterized protein